MENHRIVVVPFMYRFRLCNRSDVWLRLHWHHLQCEDLVFCCASRLTGFNSEFLCTSTVTVVVPIL